MSLNILATSIALGCIVAALAQTILPLDGEFLKIAAIASLVLLVFTIRLPRRQRSIRGK